MSRGTETKSVVTPEKECGPTQEHDTTRDAGPGNAALASQLAAAPPVDGSESPTGPLESNLVSALTNPDTPPTLPRLQGLIAAETATSRSALLHNNGFWASAMWQSVVVSRDAVKSAVDPFAQVFRFTSATSAEERTQLVSYVLTQCPRERTRLLGDARLRAALLQGLTGLDRLRVLQAVADPGAALDDPYVLLQQAVLSPSAQSDVIRDAWNEVAIDPGLMMRVAGDLELRSRIEALDADLAEQIRWEAARALTPDVNAGSADTTDGVSVTQIYEAAGRPALRALLPLPTANYLLSGMAPVSTAIRAIQTFVDDVEARLRHTGLIDQAEISAAEPTAGLAWLADTYADYTGNTIAQTASEMHASYFVTAERAESFAEWFSVAAAPSPSKQKGLPWKETRERLSRSLAASLHAARGDDGRLAGWLSQTSTTLHQAAEEKSVDAAAVEQRVAGALRTIATAYAAVFGPVEEVFTGTSDPVQRREVQQALGLRSSAAEVATQAVLSVECSDQAGSRLNPGRQGALATLATAARGTGVELARAVAASSSTDAETIALRFADALTAGIEAGHLNRDDAKVVTPIISAAYASHGGDLRHGLAQLDNSDRIFRYLGMHSTGAALRVEGDERDNDVLAAEYRANSSVKELFDAIATGHAASALGFAQKSLTAAAELTDIDNTNRTPQHAVADLYVQTYGIELSHHISTLHTRMETVELAGLFGQRAAPQPEQPDVQRIHRDYFLIDGQTPEGIDPDGTTNAGNISAMTTEHVAHLTTLAGNLDGAVGDAANGLPRFQKAIGDINMAGGMALVRPAFLRANGATLEFYLHASHARGGLSSTDLQSGLMGLDEHEQSAFTVDLLRYARGGSWSEALVLIEKAPEADRQAMLADGASMVLLRNEAPPAAWAPVYDALNGELHAEDLVADESVWTDRLESLGTWVEWSTYSEVTALYGEDEEEVDFDANAILAASREDMTLEQAALAGARAAVDGGVDARLDASMGQGDDRLMAESELAQAMGKDTKKQADQTDGLRLRQLGLAGSAQANVVDNDWWKADNLRGALEKMSDAERAMAATDAVFLDRIDRLTKDDPDQGTQLYDLLYSGEEGAEAARVTSYGTGTDGAWRGQGFEVVAALAGLSVEERAAIALDRARTEEWLRAARTDWGAEAEAKALLDTARTLAGAQYDASRSGDDAESVEDYRDDPVAVAAYRAFVAQGTAQFRAAMATKDPYGKSIAVAQGLREAAVAMQAGSSQESTTGFPITEAMTDIWLAIATELQSHDRNKHLGNTNRSKAVEQGGTPTTETYAFSRGFGNAEEQILADLRRWYAEDSGNAEMDSFRGAASSRDVPEMVRLVEDMPIKKVMRKLTNLIEMGLHGEPSLQSVYRPFKQADSALCEADESSEDYDRLLATQQLARAEVAAHPINVSQGANLYVNNASQSNVPLSAFSGAEQDQITGAIRARFKDITPDSVVEMLRADEHHASLLWNNGRAVSASVRSTRDLADRSLSAGSWGVEYLTSTDDEAATDYTLLAQGYQRALAQQEMSDEDLARLARLEGEFRVSMGEFIAAKQKVAKVVSGVTSAAIGAIITAVTAGAGAPIAAALVTTALSGSASIIIHEGILRDDYDAERATAELGVELLKTAMTAHMDKFWELGKLRMHASMLTSPTGRQLIAAHTELQRMGTSALGPLGMSLAGAAVDSATSDISDVAWKMLDPSMYQHGFDTALSDGLAEFEAALRALGPNALKSMLAEVAKAAGKRAAAGGSTPTDPDARSLGAALPEAPDPDTEPKQFLEYLKTQLAKVPAEMWSETVETGVTGLVNTAVTEGEEYLLTGDENIDVDRTIGVFQAAGLAGLKKGRDGVLGAGAAARKEHREATEAHERAPGHQARMALLDELASDLSPIERELLREWSRDNAFEPRNTDLGRLESKDGQPSVDEQDQAIRRAKAEQDLLTFRTEILAPIEQQLARHETTWGEEQSDEDRAAYREWVVATPSDIDSRLAVTPTEFIRRRDLAQAQATHAKTTDGYRSLSQLEREWFDHAAAHPTAMADLTKDNVSLQIQVGTVEQADTFQRQLQAVHTEVASEVLTDLLTGMDDDQRAWAESNADTLTRGLAMSPSNLGQNQAVVMSRVQRAYAEAQDIAVLQRVNAPE